MSHRLAVRAAPGEHSQWLYGTVGISCTLSVIACIIMSCDVLLYHKNGMDHYEGILRLFKLPQ